MYVITANKQNRNQKIFSIVVLWKQLLPKQTETDSTSFIISTWWYRYIFKHNTFILHPNNKLAFSLSSKKRPEPHQEMTTLHGFVNSCTQKIETANLVIFFVQILKRKSVLLMKAGCVPNSNTITKYLAQWVQKVKSKSFIFTITENLSLSSLCPSCSTTQLILLLPALSSYLSNTFLSSTDWFSNVFVSIVSSPFKIWRNKFACWNCMTRQEKNTIREKEKIVTEIWRDKSAYITSLFTE